MNEFADSYVFPWLINLIWAAVIFLVGRYIIRLIVNLIRRVMKRTDQAPILVNFVVNVTSMALLLVVIIIALDQLGVDTTSLIAVLGAAGIAVGLALQDSLKNFASGALMVIFRPFKTGDYVEAAGVSGSVETIHMFHTLLRTPDNKVVIVPNGQIYSDSIINYSAMDTRRIDMQFGIGYDDDIRKARQLLEGIVNADERILDDPAPQIALSELADSSVNFVVRPWVKSGDYWAVKFDITEKVKLAFDDNGISIPYPQMDVHLFEENKKPLNSSPED